jgi:hypothetical protein
LGPQIAQILADDQIGMNEIAPKICVICGICG